MEDFNITLIFNPDHFRAVYYGHGKENLFSYKPTRDGILYCVMMALIILIIYFTSFRYPAISWFMVLAVIIFLISGINTIFVINKYIKWKRRTEAFLKDIAKYKMHQLKLTSSALELTQDSTITIERWENIISAQINDEYILLHKSDGPAFIFPSSSMSNEQFLFVKGFISKKITNSQDK